MLIRLMGLVLLVGVIVAAGRIDEIGMRWHSIVKKLRSLVEHPLAVAFSAAFVALFAGAAEGFSLPLLNLSAPWLQGIRTSVQGIAIAVCAGAIVAWFLQYVEQREQQRIEASRLVGQVRARIGAMRSRCVDAGNPPLGSDWIAHFFEQSDLVVISNVEALSALRALQLNHWFMRRGANETVIEELLELLQNHAAWDCRYTRESELVDELWKTLIDSGAEHSTMIHEE